MVGGFRHEVGLLHAQLVKQLELHFGGFEPLAVTGVICFELNIHSLVDRQTVELGGLLSF